MSFEVGNEVKVIDGPSRGQTGTITAINPTTGEIVVRLNPVGADRVGKFAAEHLALKT